MRQYAFSTLPCEGWSAGEIADACKAYGFAGVELREGPGSAIAAQDSREQWQRTAAVFREAGIQVTNIGSGICVRNEAHGNGQLPQLRRLAEMAAVFGCKGIRIFLGNFAQRYDAPVEPVDHPGIVKWLQAACDLVAAHGAAIWIETHNEYATGKTLRQLLDEVDRENCRVIYDVIHPLEDGEEPEQTLLLLGKDCVHVHIKDGEPFDDPLAHDWKYTWPGEGKVPIARIVRLLEESGYKGYFSLEWESKWRKELQAMKKEPAEVFPSYIQYMENLS